MANIVRSDHGDAVQVIGLGTVQTVAVSSSSAATSNAVTSNVVRLLSTTDCHVTFAESPTATTSMTRLVANVPEYFAITPGHKVAAIRSSADGTLYVTEAS